MFQDVIGNNFKKLFEIMSFCQTIMLSSTRICCAFELFFFGGENYLVRHVPWLCTFVRKTQKNRLHGIITNVIITSLLIESYHVK